MTSEAAAKLSPRHRDCLRLVWDRQATSKEIARELGIAKSTVDKYIAEAIELLGARDRREAAAIAFGHAPRAGLGGDPAGAAPSAESSHDLAGSTNPPVVAWPWRTARRPANTLTLGQTLGWIAIIAIGSLMALALATSVGNGLPSVAWPLIQKVNRLIH